MWGYFLLVVNRMITGLVCSVLIQRAAVKHLNQRRQPSWPWYLQLANGQPYGWLPRLKPGQARPFALLRYWPGWPHLPRLACSSQVICSAMVLARLAAASPASLVKPGHLLCYGIGRAGRGFPGFLSLGQPGLWPG